MPEPEGKPSEQGRYAVLPDGTVTAAGHDLPMTYQWPVWLRLLAACVTGAAVACIGTVSHRMGAANSIPSDSYSFGMVSACALRVCRAHPPFHIRLRYSMGACNPAENIFGTGCRSQPCVCYICVPARVAMVAVRDHYCTGYPCVFPCTLVYCRGVQGCPPGDAGIRAFPGHPLTDAAFQVQASYALLSAPV